MYTESSVELKSDFYTRYGEARGQLYFERVGVPCILMDSGTHTLAFSMDCGVRAYGRGYGDVLRIMNAASDICDVKFVDGGMGAQILYREDSPDVPGIKETAAYTIEKLLRRMGCGRGDGENTLVSICDRYGSAGWCAYMCYGEVRQIPLPLVGKNVLLIRTGKKKRNVEPELLRRFREGETERIKTAVRALKECGTEVLFDMINQSQRAVETFLSPSEQALCVINSAMKSEGVRAARICDIGVICVTDYDRADSVMRNISRDYEAYAGYSAGISVVK